MDKENTLEKRTWKMVHERLSQVRYRVTADHPIFARPDRIVSALELASYWHELELAGFENITKEKVS